MLTHPLVSLAPNKRLYKAELPVRERRLLTCNKQLAGGLFTSYCSRFDNDEKAIVREFLEVAENWAEVKRCHPDLSQAQYRRELLLYGDHIAKLIRQAFGDEISRMLVYFAAKLYKHVKLQYNRLSNNCQDFCNDLLLGDEGWDKVVGRIYPPVPVNLDQPVSK